MLERIGMRSSSSRSHNLKSKIQNLKLAGFLAVFLVVGVGLAQAQQAAKVPLIGYLGITPLPLWRPATRRFGKVCGTLATRRGKTSSLSGDLQRENQSGFPTSQPNWCVSR